MTSIRILSLAGVVLALTACRDERLSVTAGDLLVQPQRVVFERAWVGVRATTPVVLQNTTREPLDVTLSIEAPFEIVATVHVPGGEAVPVELALTPSRPGGFAGTLLVTWNGNTREVTVEADAQTPPGCPARECRTFTFEPATGACVETVTADGQGCGATNQCLSDGVCLGGTCVGRARDCDDHDACTADACDAATGCLHDAVACPGAADACVVPVCDAMTGCGLAPAVDGVSCGTNDCVTAHVCIAGQCVTRAAPDGSECAPPTVCQGTGLCRAQTCEKPTPTQLQPRWRYTPAAGHTVVFLGHVDALGNLYATETWTGSPPPLNLSAPADNGFTGVPAEGADRVADVPVAAILSLSPSGVVRFRQPVVTSCAGCVYGLWFSIDATGHRLFFNALGQTQARSTDDGHLLWKTDPTVGLPAYDRRTDGGAVFSTSAPLLIADDVVGVPVIEGNGDHHSYVQAFDRATGNSRWQFHRKGHFYGSGVASSGELWTSSANCWAVAGEMARVDGAGHEQATKFVEWIPSIYGADFAIGTTGGKLHRLDSTLDLHDLTPITTASAASTPLVSGNQLVLWDSPAHTLHSVNLGSGVTAFSTPGVMGIGPDFELLRDGGVAWTAQLPTRPSGGNGLIAAIDGRGAPLLECPLAGSVDSPTTIIRGRAVLQSGADIVSYDVPGLDVEPSGWVSKQGSLQRNGRAH